MIAFLTFTSSSTSTNETAYNELHARIMTLKGLPTSDGQTLDWAKPLPHATKSWCAIPIDETCYAAMTPAEIAALQTRDQLDAAGWYANPASLTPPPWWGFLTWWR